MLPIGEIAALGTTVIGSAAILTFTVMGRRIGPFTMSHFRLLFGASALWIAVTVFTGNPLLQGISASQWMFLSLSGITGFFLCDTLLFQSSVDIGPRTTILILNLYPFVGALLAWVFLGEVLSPKAWCGMIITLGAIIWILFEKKREILDTHRKHFLRGVLFAFGSAIFQAISFIVAKPALTGPDPVNSLQATFIRALFGAIAFWAVSLFSGQIPAVVKKAQDRKTMLIIAMTATGGLAFGTWLTMVAIQNTSIGIASTLMALSPLVMIPMTAVIHKEKITRRTIIGTLISCLGVVILFNA